MHDLTTLDLARTLGNARRAELSHMFRSRSSPRHPVRSALGRTLIRAGERLAGTTREPIRTSARPLGT